MQTYQYKVVPAPKAGLKAKGVRSNEDRFALALETLMNELGAQGWDYVRTDTLPAEERQGLTGSPRPSARPRGPVESRKPWPEWPRASRDTGTWAEAPGCSFHDAG